MTKFQRAKQQTLKKWEAVLWSWVEEHRCRIITCGFCREYKSDYPISRPNNETCSFCPAFLLQGRDCEDAILKRRGRPEINEWGCRGWVGPAHKTQIPLVLAVLMYVEGMEE